MSSANKISLFYDQVTGFVNQSLVTVLSANTTAGGAVDLATAIANAKTLLENFRDKVNVEISELKEISEWDTFTIAFYGETNAGKSTLIETLRILLGDEEKIRQQKDFIALAKKLGVDADSLVNLDKQIKLLELQSTESHAHAERLKNALQDEAQKQNARLNALKATIDYKRRNFNLWQRLVFLFKKLEEEKALPALELHLVQLHASNEIKQKIIDAEPLKVTAVLDARRKDLMEVEKSFAKLAPLEDGAIIGNGRSDFTMQSRAYRFMSNGQRYQLIDVPGIEGDEKQVLGSIDASVKKAHAVFYVTRTAAPPGSGSDGKEGTIGKIKRQLGKQTEVWTIYNKSATNPIILQAETLINKNDKDGLDDMNKSLIATLGEDTYKGHICLSAMPAFLAAASCFTPNNPHVKNREKFLTSMSAADIQKRSGMDAFLHFISSNICQNFQGKIKDANVKKIRSCIQEGVEHLAEIHRGFVHAAQRLDSQQKSAAKQIDALFLGTVDKLKNECHDQLTGKKTAMRMSIYEYIDGDRSNDDFKARLENDIDELKTSVGQDLELRFSKVFEIFKYEAGEIIKKNQRSIDEILQRSINDPFSSLKLSFATDFKMSNGINVLGVLSSLGGAAGLVWTSFLASNPAGWTISAVLGAIALVFSFYKSVRGFFSSDYKKEQQRKSANENLDRVFVKLTEVLDENLESAGVKINEALSETKKQICIPYQQCVNTYQALEDISKKMIDLRDRLAPKQPPSVAMQGAIAS